MKVLLRASRAFAATAVLSAALTAQGPVIINEIHGFGQGVAVPSLPSGDYIELWNQSPTPIQLGGWTLGIWQGNTGAVTNIVLPAGTGISGNCFFVLQEGGVLGAPACGCASGPVGFGGPGVLFGLALLARRRATRPRGA